MKVINLTVQNLKNVSRIHIQLDPNLNVVAGDNGAGKSTLIESIFMAILGKKAMGKEPWRLINKNQDKASIALTLQDEERIIDIERKITEKGVYLDVSSSDGKKLGQEDLDALLSEFTIDPLSFSRLKPKEQIETVKKLAKIDTTELESEHQKLYDERTYINRIVKEQETLLSKYGDVRPKEKVVISDIAKELEDANENNRKIEDMTNSIEKWKSFLQTKTQEIKELEEKLKKAHEDYQRATDRIDQYEKDLTTLKTIDTTEIRTRLQNAEEINKMADGYTKYLADRSKFDEYLTKQKQINNSMDAITDAIKATITSAKLPINGVSFDENVGLVIEGIPFSQKSSAEQLKIAAELATFSNPELKVVYIKDGSLLDSKSKEVLKKLAEEKDYQILMEVVGNGDTGSILLSNGELV